MTTFTALKKQPQGLVLQLSCGSNKAEFLRQQKPKKKRKRLKL
jgi:hypothetical protein